VRSGFGLPPGAPHTRLPLTRTGLIALGVLLAACASRGSPATTPPIVATIISTSTTLDRLAEVEAIVQDLEERRLDALYRKDIEALREVFASEGLYEQTVAIIDQVELREGTQVEVHISELLADEPNCLAAQLDFRYREVSGETETETVLTVLQPTDSNAWGFAYYGQGWLCNGPNPMDES
jgi:3-dehydroquinate dehydratase